METRRASYTVKSIGVPVKQKVSSIGWKLATIDYLCATGRETSIDLLFFLFDCPSKERKRKQQNN